MRIPNFVEKYIIEDNICDGLFDYYTNNNDYKIKGKQVCSVALYTQNKNQWVQAYEEAILQCVKEYCEKYKMNQSKLGLHNGSLITCYPPNIGHINHFYERNSFSNQGNLISSRVLIYVTYLNDIEPGGEIDFYWQKLKIKPKKGLTLLWPTEFTHAYKHLGTSKKEKYLVTGYINYI